MPDWTSAQEQAINEPFGEGSILVSAAAGSGKTAVLVERIAGIVLRRENNVNIDDLLVVTFTEKAAAQMKDRIIDRFNDEYKDAVQKGDTDMIKHIKEQIHLTAADDINTIDSFCLGVVKDNFHTLGIDPNFSVMDEQEGEILTEDALTELFESLYASEDAKERARFENMVKLYASNRDDEGLKSIVKKLYKFTQSFAEPQEWMREKALMHSPDMTESVYVNTDKFNRIREQIFLYEKSVWEKLAMDMEGFGEPETYWGELYESVKSCRDAVGMLEKKMTWEEMYDFNRTYILNSKALGASRRAYPKGIEASEDEWTEFNERYKENKKHLVSGCKSMPVMSRTDFNKSVHTQEVRETIDDIIWLTGMFTDYYDAKKDRRNIKSFSDIEHLAYRLFKENESVSAEYAERYKEILIDEYQDTNGLQDAIFTSISRGGKNIFMVGDLKQSIYRFRGGDPMIFKEKNGRFAKGEDGKRIMLSQNFRSRMEVINGINSVFEVLMSDEVGDVDYTDGERLTREEKRECYKPCPEPKDDSPEFYRIAVIENEAEEGTDASRCEGAKIAQRINELIESGYKVQDKNGEYRPLRYGDIVILMKSVKTEGPVIRDELERRGVKAFVQKEEYFERREIKLMLSLISLINNHLQDIPLTAVMRSPIGGFTDSELAKIRVSHRGGAFYNAVAGYKAENDSDTRLEKKCRRFVSDLERWRGYVKRKSIAALIWTLYEETKFYDFMGALEGGEEAQANLKLLYERAKRYEESGFKGIFDFMRYITRMENRREDIAGAQLVNENHNVVRIMTIHKSKGLEFPVVFFSRTTKQFVFSRPDDETRLVLHKELGIGIDYYNYEDMFVKRLRAREIINEANKGEFLSEEMRLMYVALTRAREKLIVTASYSFKDREECENKYLAQSKLNDVSSGRSYADWIAYALSHAENGWHRADVEYTTLETQSADEADEVHEIENEEEVRREVKKLLEYSYKYTGLGAVPAKTSVTAIKEMADEEHLRENDPVYMNKQPAFMRGENMGARIGTAHHQVMAFIDLDKLRALTEDSYERFVMSEIGRIASEGQIEAEIAADKDIKQTICENVCGFFKSGMGKAVLSARSVYRERPFEIEIDAEEYDAKIARGSGEKVIVQGIIDLFFENTNGEIILVDYKTDRCKTEEEIRAVGERYAKQIELYSRAMETILKRNVKEKYLYLFSAQSVLKL